MHIMCIINSQTPNQIHKEPVERCALLENYDETVRGVNIAEQK